jgi:hypothetical protein
LPKADAALLGEIVVDSWRRAAPKRALAAFSERVKRTPEDQEGSHRGGD